LAGQGAGGGGDGAAHGDPQRSRGKSTLLAWLVLWFISTHFPCKVGTTAPTERQLKDILWTEIGTWFRRLPPAWQARRWIRLESGITILESGIIPICL